MHDWPDSKRRYFTVEDMIPYFQSRAKQKRICPKCHRSALAVKPTALNPNGAVDYCPKCGYLQVVIAPREAQVSYDWMPMHKREEHGKDLEKGRLNTHAWKEIEKRLTRTRIS